MEPKTGARVTIAIVGRAIALQLTSHRAGTRVSPKGQMEMIGEARRLLEKGESRHFWLEAIDEQRRVLLHPYDDGQS